MNRIDRFLNGITMYRLVLYGLLAISGVACVLSGFDVLGYPITALVGSLATLTAVGFVFHWLLVKLFKSAPSTESWLITVLILFLILKPAESVPQYAVLALGVILATVSKYVLTYGNRHIFNPVAIALVILGLLGSGELFWWVGAQYLLPIVLAVGLLVVRKIHRFDTVLTFIAAALITYVISRGVSIDSLAYLKTIFLSGPLVFFAMIMLTEPQTSPPTRKIRLVFAVIVGILFSLPFELKPFYTSPELALVIGNLFTLFASSRRRTRLELRAMNPQGTGVYEFSFTPDHPIRFKPGQYLEWTLPHEHTDSRGDRRYFTIASAPTETDLKLVARIDPEHFSSFKKALLAMQPGDEMWVSQLSGDFTLPRKTDKKLVFIAGGIGITPFRSIVQNLIDNQQQCDAILYYSSVTPDGFSYWQTFNQAVSVGLKPNYVITGGNVPEGWTGKTGYLTAEQIQTEVPDYKKRTFYLSGPNVMVTSYKKMLLQAGVSRRHIHTDYFPGF